MVTTVYQQGGQGSTPGPVQTVISVRAPTTTDKIAADGSPYQVAVQYWQNTTTGNLYQYAGGGTWNLVSEASGGPIDTLTGDSGGAIGPVAGNITIAGGTGINTAGTAGTITVNLSTPVSVAHGGTGAATLTGILTGNGTSAITANTVTQNGVLVGGASNAAASTAVGATGTVLQGNSAAAPSFGVMGANANASWSLVDDFFPSSVLSANLTAQPIVGQLNWATVGTIANAAGTAAHPGQIVATAAGAVQGVYLSDATPTLPLIVGAGAITLNWVIALNTLSTGGATYTAIVGLTDNNTATATIANGIFFSYTNATNSGKWVVNTSSASTQTNTNTTVAAVTTFVNLGMTINAAASSVAFTINGTAVGTITTNIPATGIFPTCSFARASGNAPAASIDLFYATQLLTTAR